MIDWTTVSSVLVAIAIYKLVQLIQIAFGLFKKLVKSARGEIHKSDCEHTPETIGGFIKSYPTHPVKYKCVKCGEFYCELTRD